MEESELKKLIDEYGDIANKKEFLAMEKKKLIDGVIPDSVKMEIDSINAEFEEKETALELEEKKKKKEVDVATDKYAQSLFVGKEKIHLKTGLMTLTISEGEPIWDSSALDGYALGGHEELLKFRHPGKNKTRLTRNK